MGWHVLFYGAHGGFIHASVNAPHINNNNTASPLPQAMSLKQPTSHDDVTMTAHPPLHLLPLHNNNGIHPLLFAYKCEHCATMQQ